MSSVALAPACLITNCEKHLQRASEGNGDFSVFATRVSGLALALGLGAAVTTGHGLAQANHVVRLVSLDRFVSAERLRAGFLGFNVGLGLDITTTEGQGITTDQPGYFGTGLPPSDATSTSAESSAAATPERLRSPRQRPHRRLRSPRSGHTPIVCGSTHPPSQPRHRKRSPLLHRALQSGRIGRSAGAVNANHIGSSRWPAGLRAGD